MTADRLSQRMRLFVLATYVGLLCCTSKFVFGTWVPSTDQRGLWFYSGLAALVLGSLLVTPFFSKPVDSVSYSVAGLASLLPFYSAAIGTPDKALAATIWYLVVSYLGAVLLIGLSAIALKDATRGFWQRLGQTCYEMGTRFGTPKLIFSSVFLFAVLAFHRNKPKEYLVLTLAWVVLIGLAPIEEACALVFRILSIWCFRGLVEGVGTVVGHELPNVLIINTEAEILVFGEPLVARGCDGQPCAAVALDKYGFADNNWHRAYEIPVTPSAIHRLYGSALEYGERADAFRVTEAQMNQLAPEASVWQAREMLIGIVSASTNLERLQIEVVRDHADLQSGCTVCASVRGRNVLYQVIEGVTAEEAIQQKNTRGFVRATGRRLGSWDPESNRLRYVKWIPSPNAPVFVVKSVDETFIPEAIGHLPNTSYPLFVDPDLLVTHNTAILGVLGSGKSYLALELVERIILARIKTICLDLTNQYANELAPYFDAEDHEAQVEGLQAVASEGKTNVKQNVEEGGSVREFRDLLHALLEAFLDTDQQDSFAMIFNPAQFEVWRQDSKMFSGNASMASLTTVEITRIITEVCLEVLQAQGMAESAKCCIVYEEAHSLVPEWNSAAAGTDQSACNGTAKAILQGRKFGLGCIAVTQRTANITKSILNQCNTVFALRTFDATGVEFLRNYVGSDYANVLSTLEERHAVIFGRGSSFKEPAIISLNDRTAFLASVRTGGQA